MIQLIAMQFLSLTLATVSTMNMGADHEDGNLTAQPAWPAGLHKVINKKNRVHGFWVNTTDVFFYRGDSAQLNSMIDALGAIQGVNRKIVLHAGKGDARSPWGTGKGMANWSVTSYCAAGFGKQDSILIDIWIGEQVELKKLKIPTMFDVEDGGEIESFIKNLKAKSR